MLPRRGDGTRVFARDLSWNGAAPGVPVIASGTAAQRDQGEQTSRHDEHDDSHEHLYLYGLLPQWSTSVGNASDQNLFRKVIAGIVR